MPWNFHVTRAIGPYDRAGFIPLSDWEAVVGRDPDLSLVASHHAGSGAGPLTAADWYGHPGGGMPIRFEWLSGAIVAERPDAETIAKLHNLAHALGGHVEDDDGGWYDARGHFLGHLAAG